MLNNGTNADIIATNAGNIFVPKMAENFAYDADGNRTNDGRFNYTWDAENRAVKFERITSAPTASKVKLDCSYDYWGRRIQKIVSTNNGSVYVAQSTNKFVYDGWNLVAILDATNGLVCSFTWGTDASGTMQGAGGVGGLISMTVYQGTNAGTYFYCYDGNHNVVGLVNAANGAMAGQWEYDPFLGIIRASGALALVNPFLGSTKFYDWETGLYYYGYRYYDPSSVTWPNRDPLEEEDSANLYGFIGNDGVNAFDVLGLWKSWTHKDLTKQAWNGVQKPDGMTAEIQKQLLGILTQQNVGVDSGETYGELYWHFNRPLDPEGSTEGARQANIQQYIQLYLDNLADNQTKISKDISAHSKVGCADALQLIGKLSHPWQDYYAHAVNVNYHGGRDFNKIGNMSGDPEHPGADMKPSSWGGTWHPGEHRWVEPGMRAPDSAARLQQAASYTQGGYQTFLGKWWPVCKCYYLKESK